jgi:PBP1b-binding outer membrane lipoprotein LpoB
MKRLILILIVAVFITGIFASCNQSICPAYSSTDDTEQTEYLFFFHNFTFIF